MSNQLTVFLPGYINSQNRAEVLAQLPALKQLFNYSESDKFLFKEVSAAINHLPLAKTLASYNNKSTENTWEIIVQCVHIDLDQTQGYLRLIDTHKIEDNVKSALHAVLETWAKAYQLGILPLKDQLSWLVSSNKALTQTCYARPEVIVGEAIAEKMPLPEDGKIFQWFNELQMLFYSQPQIRSSGINAIWFWGNGERVAKYDGFISNDENIKVFAKYQHFACATNYNADILNTCKNILFIDTQSYIYKHQNPLSYLTSLDDTLFRPLLNDYKKKKITALNLCFADNVSVKLKQANVGLFKRIFGKL